jgi:hypothetical protein
MIGCAGPAKLAQRSEEKLAAGDAWHAWQLAIRSLDRQPGNPRARDAATAAGAAIAQDWQRRIRALADLDSVQAAEQVLEFVEFRANAARYATIPLSSGWPNEEQTLRRSAARIHYQSGNQALAAQRPKKAYLEFHEAERFVTPYRDASRLADRAFEKALTRVAVVPFNAAPEHSDLAAQVANSWRGDLVQGLSPPNSWFTKMLSDEDVTRSMTVSQLGRLSRDEALQLARKAGAQRLVYGSLGDVRSQTRLQFFKESVSRRIVVKGPDGQTATRWVDVPIEVVARIRDVTVGVDYEILSTRDGASLAHQSMDRTTSARVVWTSYQPEGDLDAYSLVSDTYRAAHPDEARGVEKRWKDACGEGTTLQQVLQARRATRDDGRYRRDSLGRFIAGAAFVFLEDLPPSEDLAFAALAKGSSVLRDDLRRLDPIDDVDLGVTVTSSDSR